MKPLNLPELAYTDHRALLHDTDVIRTLRNLRYNIEKTIQLLDSGTLLALARSRYKTAVTASDAINALADDVTAYLGDLLTYDADLKVKIRAERERLQPIITAVWTRLIYIGEPGSNALVINGGPYQNGGNIPYTRTELQWLDYNRTQRQKTLEAAGLDADVIANELAKFDAEREQIVKRQDDRDRERAILKLFTLTEDPSVLPADFAIPDGHGLRYNGVLPLFDVNAAVQSASATTVRSENATTATSSVTATAQSSSSSSSSSSTTSSTSATTTSRAS